MNLPRVVGLVGLAGIMVLTGCGHSHLKPADPGPVAPTGGTPEQRARADTKTLLKAFHPPDGAKAEDHGSGVLPSPGGPMTPDLASASRYWTVHSDAATVLAWVKAHPPAGMRYYLSGSGSDRDRVTEMTLGFQAPPVAQVLPQRDLMVSAADAGNGVTELRATAQVVWLPVKPAAERLPVTNVMTAQAVYPMGDGRVRNGTRPGRYVTPVSTITDRATIARVVAMLNGLPTVGPGVRHCPMSTGGSMELAFKDSATGPAVATATVGLSGCRGVGMTVRGAVQPGLDGTGLSVEQLAAMVHVRLLRIG